ncbi:MAG: ABC transporter ATP-binding protein [Polaromonas sp.]|nr:ABC transporter ATP-binding protein [Polaromonas sp.]
MSRFLELEDVRYAYPGQNHVVHGVSLHIAPGDFHCLIGRSGCGKTTLLKLAAGLLQPQSGAVTLQGVPVSEPTADMGFVFQSPTLLEWLTVLDNVLLPIALHGKVQAAQHEKAKALLDQLDLNGMQSRYPQQLSGGQQSRVAIARALITAPPILFMDEPFASLDAITRSELQQDLLALCQSQGTSVLFITHDIAEAVYLADNVSVMQSGTICHQLAVDLLHPRQPALRYTADFNARCAELRQAMDGSL